MSISLRVRAKTSIAKAYQLLATRQTSALESEQVFLPGYVVVTVLLARQMLTPLERVDDAALIIEDGIIATIGKRSDLTIPANARTIDFGDSILTPGLVDIHIHGAAGHDVMEGDDDCLAAIERLLTRHGVTSYCPTTVTAPMNDTLIADRKSV